MTYAEAQLMIARNFLVDIATTSKGYPNGSREGQLAIKALNTLFGYTEKEICIRSMKK